MFKEEIYKENKNKSGIYCWKNLINNKIYVGSAINLIKIFTVLHSTKCLMYTSNKSHNALLKYGYENYNTIIRLNILFFL